jgi:ornithine cyclodeaminase/alanine dehydrogenase-like protein (mu-crystallin family)
MHSEQVLQLLPMRECIEAVAEALRSVSSNKAAMPLRAGFRMPLQKEGKVGILASMPAYTSYDDGTEFCATKVITVFPGNVSQGIHSHQVRPLSVNTLILLADIYTLCTWN